MRHTRKKVRHLRKPKHTRHLRKPKHTRHLRKKIRRTKTGGLDSIWGQLRPHGWAYQFCIADATNDKSKCVRKRKERLSLFSRRKMWNARKEANINYCKEAGERKEAVTRGEAVEENEKLWPSATWQKKYNDREDMCNQLLQKVSRVHVKMPQDPAATLCNADGTPYHHKAAACRSRDYLAAQSEVAGAR